MDLKLSNVTLLFFPPNTTSKVQPLDEGIIRCFKTYYRSQLVKHIIGSCTLTSTPDRVVVTALDAIYWIAKAWNDVSESTIRNTFRTAGFERHRAISTIKDNTEEISEITVDPTDLFMHGDPLQKLDALLSYVTFGGAHLSASEFVNVDEEISLFNEWDNDANSLLAIEDVQHDQDGRDDEETQEQPPSLDDALEMIRKLHLLILDLESKLIDAYLDSKTNKQNSITDFFQKSLILNSKIGNKSRQKDIK